MASINDLTILSNLESLNSALIKSKIDKKNRFKILLETVKDQRKSLESIDIMKSIKKLSNSTYIDVDKNIGLNKD